MADADRAYGFLSESQLLEVSLLQKVIKIPNFLWLKLGLYFGLSFYNFFGIISLKLCRIAQLSLWFDCSLASIKFPSKSKTGKQEEKRFNYPSG
jgi:hypothetical protein